jgi:hypothetical protein
MQEDAFFVQTLLHMEPYDQTVQGENYEIFQRIVVHTWRHTCFVGCVWMQ